MSESVKFTNSDGTLNKDGARLVEWLNTQFSGADATNDLSTLNGLAGPIRQYYIDVFKMGQANGLSSEAWLKTYEKTWARDCHKIMTYVESVANETNRVNEATSKADTVAGELSKFKEDVAKQVADMQAELDALRAEKAAKVAKKPAKAADASGDSDDEADDASEET